MTKALPLLNRELSRLDYNARVLAKAEEASVPLLARLQFLAWCSRNLDEFFMVRVGATRDLIEAGVSEPSPDGLLPAERLAAMQKRTGELLAQMDRCLTEDLLPRLRSEGVAIETFGDLPADDQQWVRDYFAREVAPVLTPLAIDPGHPFPFVGSSSLTVAVTIEAPRADSTHVVLMKLPPLLPRFVALPDGKRFVPMKSIIIANTTAFFPSFAVKEGILFRVIRNSELSLDSDEVQDLRDSVEAELRRRDRRQVVCLEIEARASEELVGVLVAGTGARPQDVYRVSGFVKMSDFEQICEAVPDAALHYPAFNARLPQRLASADDLFSIIAAGDVLLHRPYDSFTAVVEFVHAAATDPAVLAIKMALYQTDEGAPIVDNLVLAANSGKQVSVVIELQARFEERKNIALARRLQDAGVQIVYGLVGLQTHAKLCVVIRSEGGQLRHYVHLSTGNYTAEAARSYTDLDLLTANPAFGREASLLMNILTGYSARSATEVFERGGERPRWEELIIAPFDFHRWLIARIEREAAHAAAGRPARISAKLNSLVDTQVIQALSDASTAGVKIDLIVRAICCLVPGVRGVSENIRVMSIVDRFLEHERIIHFENGGTPEYFLSSGDWMPRNFVRRIEVTFPVLDAASRKTVSDVLDLSLGDTVSSWDLRSDGQWHRRSGREKISSQRAFIDIARAESVKISGKGMTRLRAGRLRARTKARDARSRR
ncbi:MAG TPA: polyphosphate kinase 1 [Thermoanaerobaculia bacterium]|nr:polyphosphate kinase 1 [Thermoanaerobaculia bacterium]